MPKTTQWSNYAILRIALTPSASRQKADGSTVYFPWSVSIKVQVSSPDGGSKVHAINTHFGDPSPTPYTVRGQIRALPTKLRRAIVADFKDQIDEDAEKGDATEPEEPTPEPVQPAP